jgi:exodeoxyribonuclease VII small subunit
METPGERHEPADDLSFEAALTELEAIVRTLEDGETSLEQSLAQYERGVGLLKLCYGQLRQAEQRILLLTGEDGDGQPLTRPFEHAASLEIARATQERRPRKRPPEEA